MKTLNTFLFSGGMIFFSSFLIAQSNHLLNAKHISLQWNFIQNNYEGKSQFLSSISIKNKNTANVPVTGWRLYFSLRYHSPALASLNDKFSIKHVSGDLFYITPTSIFKGLAQNENATIQYTGSGRIANYKDVPSGFFWVDETDTSKATSLPEPAVNSSALPVMDAGKIFHENELIENIPEKNLPKILPTPVNYTALKGTFVLDQNIAIATDAAFINEANYFAEEINTVIGIKPVINQNNTQRSKSLLLKKDSSLPEAYTLIVTQDSIVMTAGDGAGIFYAMQSLKCLLPPAAWKAKHTSLQINCAEISDAPRFAVRAFMLDVSRNFQPKTEILKLLDLMALYKLNVFHFHLTDDEGWRIEIPGLPELTSVGSIRGYPFNTNERLHPSYGSGADADNKSGSGFYSADDFIEILQYATQRRILVIPEIESPGHARAAIKSMESRYNNYIAKGDTANAMQYLLYEKDDSSKYMSNQYFNDNVMNAALLSTYNFIEKVIDELVIMYKKAGAPFTNIHMGGDEVPHGVWERSPAIKNLQRTDTTLKTSAAIFKHYFNKVQQHLQSLQLNLNAWEELATGTQTADERKTVFIQPEFINSNTTLEAWWNQDGNEDIAYKLANAGYKVVLSCIDYFYFDLAYKPSFNEPGDGWVGYLDIDKTFSFIPLDYYKNDTIKMAGGVIPATYFKNKERLTAEGTKNIKGIQGALWAENIKSPDEFEYLLVPRLLALAERAWAKDPEWATTNDATQSQNLYHKAWSVFANTVGKRELPRLSFYHGGFNYRVPVVGVSEVNNLLKANVQLPGLEIRYATNGSEPGANSQLYTTPIPAQKNIKFKAFVKGE